MMKIYLAARTGVTGWSGSRGKGVSILVQTRLVDDI